MLSVDVVKELDDVLICNVDVLCNYMVDWVVIMLVYIIDVCFKGWKDGEDEEGNCWWVLLVLIMIVGRFVLCLVKVG